MCGVLCVWNVEQVYPISTHGGKSILYVYPLGFFQPLVYTENYTLRRKRYIVLVPGTGLEPVMKAEFDGCLV
jgi:hypothetical protein